MNCQVNGEVVLRDLQYIDLDYDTLEVFRLRRGDILFNRTNSYELVGRSAIFDHDIPAVFASYLIRLSIDESRVDPAYLNFLLNWDVAQVELKKLASRGVSQANISASKLLSFHVHLPTLEEQQGIAAVLRRTRNLIDRERQLCERLAKLKRAAMRELFTRGLRGEPQRETEIGLMPESWQIVRVGDQAEAVSKGASPKWQGFDYVDSGVLFLRSQNVGDGRLELDERVYLPTAWNEKEKRSILQPGDLLINLVGASIGRSAVGGDEIDGANCNQAVCFVRLKQDRVCPKFLNGFLLGAEGQRQIHDSKKDIARANLSLEDVRQISMPKPPMEEQREIAAVLEAIDRRTDLHWRKRRVLDELFRALLHKLMLGEIQVADLDLSTVGAGEATEAAA
jgi:type I restriction enzyme S subunit